MPAGGRLVKLRPRFLLRGGRHCAGAAILDPAAESVRRGLGVSAIGRRV
jgi:hypothetical protein